jgi:thiamine biosynthesis lipoprotein
MRQHSRRRFLLIAAGAAGAAAVGGPFLGRDRRWPVVTRTTHALGTEVSLAVRHVDSRLAEAAIDAAFAELAYLEHRLLSIYQQESQISRLNREGVLNDPSPFVVYVLRQAQAMSRETGGAFDVTVQPLWEVYAAAMKQGRLPAASAVAAARAKVDWQRLEVGDDRIRFQQPGMKLTLNGIAQGFASDRVLATLRGHGIDHALINVGEHASLGEAAAGDPWTVGIQHPRHEDAFVALADLDGRCLATSGDYATTFTPDRANNHIFDPRSGLSPTELASVSVVAPTAMQADALSTATFVLGPDKGLDLIGRTPRTDAFFVLKDGETIATAGFPLTNEGRVS